MSEASELALPSRALLDFRKRFAWQGARAPVELALTDTALRLEIPKRSLEKEKQRQAVKLLVGEDAYSRLRPSDSATVEIDLRAASFDFPRVLGRGGFKFKLPNGREFAVVFSDWSGVEGVVGRSDARVLAETAKVMQKGPQARKAREAWREAIEAKRGS